MGSNKGENEMKTKKAVDVCGDKLTVAWDGNVWVSPHNGQQHSRAEHAMRSELEAYFRSCGDDIEDEETAEEIDGYLSQMVDDSE
jgi:hypothetical protein